MRFGSTNGEEKGPPSANRTLHRTSKSDDITPSPSGPVSRVEFYIRLSRILFVGCLVIAATVLGASSYFLLRKSERNLADTHFESIADRALTEASAALLGRRWLTITMASVIAEILPNASEYPFVSVPGYERIAHGILNAKRTEDTAVSFFVRPDQLEDWEAFAYDFFYNKRKPEPFPNTTAVSSFGRGVWGISVETNAMWQSTTIANV